MRSEATARAEVVRLHRFFDAWYAGEEGLTIDEFANAMDPRFSIVSPEGQVLDCNAVVSAVRDGYGRGGVTITVGEFNVVERTDYVVVRYEEVHASSDGTTTRISTAVMEPDANAPGGYRWISVHETWAPT